MSAQTAATRLRRTFHYPSESDDEDAVEAGMDEQDQAHLLTTLSTHDTHTTSTYTHLLLVLPLLPILLYIPHFFRLSTLPAAGLAIPSLLASAYTLYFLPLPPVQISVSHVVDLQSPSARSRTKPAETKAERPPVPYISEATADLVARYIVVANGALCAVLAIAEMLQGRSWGEGVTVGGGYLPGLVFTVVMFARRELRAVDMSELERLQYQSKGT
ncbi:uncharacterized protein CC84DRAFT_1117904 [Paraphaeosphaeria sporulosa]|uniref:Uncharacterized protein n=1 Tax=Paraphaeosphaeria sporulosa TaxID=1460663 RepID=A0A177CJ20_9PLEO|nr:uncharacterized protein CC84DRAFT_1117904 [Paraphaeosphaeria sporulosa]OAG07515.1 hypothetical protein CC84DRAFT_1117904 [Paraphaeosphaeria sporulosa]